MKICPIYKYTLTNISSYILHLLNFRQEHSGAISPFSCQCGGRTDTEHSVHKDEFLFRSISKGWRVLSVPAMLTCSAFWCAAEWSRKALNEARPWWRRDSSSWKWVSERDCEEPSPSAADHVIQQELLSHVFGMLRFLPHRVWMDPRRARLCSEAIFILWIWRKK